MASATTTNEREVIAPHNEAWITLLFLTLAYIANQWARFSFAYLAGVTIAGDCDDECQNAKQRPLCPTHPGDVATCNACYLNASEAKYNLKQGTCLNETEFAFLVSYGFVALFAIAGLFAGRISDMFKRKNVIVAAAFGWGIATMVQGAAHNYATMLLSRAMMGFCCAFLNPAAYSLIKDKFPDSTASANGIYSLGVYVGGGLSSLSIKIAREYGWRITSRVIGGIGILAGLGMMLIKEPARQQVSSSSQPQRTMRETLLVIARGDRAVLLVFVAASLRFFGGFALGAYLPQFYKRKFPSHNATYSVLNAFVVSLAGAASSIGGGKLADHVSLVYDKRARAWIPGIGAVIGLGPLLWALYTNSFYVSIFMLFLSYLLVECWFGPALSIIQNRTNPEYRALAISIYLFFGSMLGNLSPILIASVDDETQETLTDSLAFVTSFSYVSCAIVFYMVGRVLGKDEGDGREDARQRAPLLQRGGDGDEQVRHDDLSHSVAVLGGGGSSGGATYTSLLDSAGESTRSLDNDE